MKGGVRILRPPHEYEQIKQAIPKQDHRTILDTLLYTGMRYVEMERFRDNQNWYDHNTGTIYLPKEASRKGERTLKDRYVYLSAQGQVIIPYFFHINRDITNGKIWSLNVKRWARNSGMNDIGISAKTTRKTWESWLCVTYPTMIPPLIAMSQGHTVFTAITHYLNLPFTTEERDTIRGYTTGWAGAEQK